MKGDDLSNFTNPGRTDGGFWYKFSTLPVQYSSFDRWCFVETKLVAADYETLNTLLASFPHSNTEKWPEKFKLITESSANAWLLKLAANAVENPWADGNENENQNAMLAVACEYGRDAGAVHKLIKFGANVNYADRASSRTAIFWAICNKSLYSEIYDASALTVLLEHRAKTRVLVNKETAYDYAISQLNFWSRSGKNLNAATLIAQHESASFLSVAIEIPYDCAKLIVIHLADEVRLILACINRATGCALNNPLPAPLLLI